MITWPFDAAANGLPTTVRDKGAYAYLHVCGSPWEGNEYHEGDKAVWTMSYARQRMPTIDRVYPEWNRKAAGLSRSDVR
jgi:hypothetical protein